MDTTGPGQPPKKPDGQDPDAPEKEAPASDTPVPTNDNSKDAPLAGQTPAEPSPEQPVPVADEAKPVDPNAPLVDPNAPPADPDAPPPDPADDWWENFSKAVEDPNVSIYEYLRNNAMEAMDLENKDGAPSALTQAREAALRELFSLTKPDELSKKLAALEKNALLFNANARAVMKVSRAVLDTYIKTRDESKDGKEPEDMGAAIGANLKKELEGAQDEMNPALASVARSLKDKDEKEVAATIRKAAAQMGEERNVTAMMRDAVVFTRRYLKPDNIVNIAIIALPLITWQYRWALAIGLGAFAGRHTVRHGYNALKALYKGDKVEARAQGREAVTNLKSAGGSVLLIALTPVLAKFPLLAAGFIGFAAEAAYNKVLDTFNKMLAQEEKVPGSTPLGKRMKAGIKTFFATYQDTLAALTAKTLKTVAPGTVTHVAEAISKRLPLSKMRKVAARGWMLTGALTKRFNRIARAKAKEFADDVVDMGKDFFNAVEGALSDAAAIATQKEAEFMAEQLLLEERARAIAEEEAALEAAAKEAQKEQEAYAEGADDGMTEEAAGEEATEAQKAQALKKRKLEVLERYERRVEAQKQRQTLKAKPN